MGFWARAFGFEDEARASPENPSTNLADPASWLHEALGGGLDDVTGASVSHTTVLGLPAFYSAVRLISETVGSLPLPLYERTETGGRKGRDRATDHELYPLLHDTPNPEMTAGVFRETLQAHALTWGNAYAEIQRDGAGRAVHLWPLLPDRTEERRTADGQRVYLVKVGSETVLLPGEDVLHIPGMGFDGRKGYSLVSLFRRSLGLAMATEEYGARFFGNNARPGGVLKAPGVLSPEAQLRLKTSWEKAQGGLSNAHRVAVLEQGVEWQAMGLPNEDAQFLETRQFQLAEIARMTRVPLHLLFEMAKGASYASVEQLGQEFLTYTLRPWLVRWEQYLGLKLLSDQERRRFYFEHIVDGLLRGDVKTRNESYAVALTNGYMTPNEVRERENLNPINLPAMDEPRLPMNMVPASKADEVPVKPEAGSQSTAGGSPQPGAGDPDNQGQRMRESFGDLVADALNRAARREAQIVPQALAKGKTAEAALEGHADYLVRALTPVLTAYARATGHPPAAVVPFVQAETEAMVRDAIAGWGDPESRTAALDVPDTTLLSRLDELLTARHYARAA